MPPSLGQTVCGRVAGKWWPQRVHSRWVRRDMGDDRLTFSGFRAVGFRASAKHSARSALGSDVSGNPWLRLVFCLGFDFFFCRHGRFEAANAFSEALAEFGKLFGTEDEQCDSEYYEHVQGLKQSFEHDDSFFEVRG